MAKTIVRNASLISTKALIPLFLFSLSFLVYFFTLNPTLAPQGDSGELVAAAYTLGIAHPPGYPLYILLAHFFIKLVPFGSIAFRANFLSTLLHSAALVFFYLVLKQFFAKAGSPRPLSLTNSLLAALTASLILAFSYTFWLYSLVAEVFALNNLLTLLLIYSAFKFKNQHFPPGRWKAKRFNNPKSTWKVEQGFGWLYFAIFIFFLGLSNHHTIILILPAIIYLLWPEIKNLFKEFKKKPAPGLKFTAWSLALGAAGLTPYVYILWAARQFPPPSVAWIFPQTLKDLLKLFLRVDYGTFSPLSNYDVSLATLTEKADQLANYFKFAFDDFTILGLGLAAAGLIFGLKNFRSTTIFALIGFFFAGVFFLTYSSFPFKEGATSLGVVERFYLLPNLFFSLFIALGLLALFNFLDPLYLKLSVLKYPLAVFIVFEVSIFNFHLVNQSQNYSAQVLGENILKTAEPNSIIILQGDIPTFAAFYARYVNGIRQDLEFITPNFYHRGNNFSYLKAARPDLNFNFDLKDNNLGFLKTNAAQTPVYSYSVPRFDYQGFEASPSGMLFRFYEKNKLVPQSQWLEKALDDLAQLNLPIPDEIVNFKTIADYGILNQYLNLYIIYSQMYFLTGNFEKALVFLDQALDLEPVSTSIILRKGEIFQKLGQCQSAEAAFRRVLELNSQVSFVYDKLVGLGKECYQDQEKIKEFEALRFQTLPASLKEL